jgi:hypothetical protein
VIVGARKAQLLDDVIAAASFDVTQLDLVEIEIVSELAGSSQ